MQVSYLGNWLHQELHPCKPESDPSDSLETLQCMAARLPETSGSQFKLKKLMRIFDIFSPYHGLKNVWISPSSLLTPDPFTHLFFQDQHLPLPPAPPRPPHLPSSFERMKVEILCDEDMTLISSLHCSGAVTFVSPCLLFDLPADVSITRGFGFAGVEKAQDVG